MKDLAILVPSRNRPQAILELMESMIETGTVSDLIVIVDDDDVNLNEYLAGSTTHDYQTFIVKREGKGMAKPLNKAARNYLDDYRHFAFLGDDHRPRTAEWDIDLIDELDRLGTGLAYGNDLFMSAALPTAIAMTGNIVEALGGMVPDGMIHLYLDNFWLRLGKDLGAISYLEDVIIEHMHPAAGKGVMDAGYQEVNASEVYDADKKALDEYLASPAYSLLLSKLSA